MVHTLCVTLIIVTGLADTLVLCQWNSLYEPAGPSRQLVASSGVALVATYRPH